MQPPQATPGSPCPPDTLPIPRAALALLYNTWPDPRPVPPPAPLLSVSLIGNISQQGTSAGDCPSRARRKQGSAVLGCEPEAPLKLPPGPGPAGASPLCPGAVAPSKEAHQSSSCLSIPPPRPGTKRQFGQGVAGEMGRQGQGPRSAGEMGIVLLQAPRSTCRSPAPAQNRHSEGLGRRREGSIMWGRSG